VLFVLKNVFPIERPQCPVNIDTDGRLVWTRVHREFFRDNTAGFDFRKPGLIYIDEYASLIAHKNTKLGSAGTLEDARAALAKQVEETGS